MSELAWFVFVLPGIPMWGCVGWVVVNSIDKHKEKKRQSLAAANAEIDAYLRYET